jgi:hypothetical protein
LPADLRVGPGTATAGAGGPGANAAQTNLFTVIGKLSELTAVAVPRGGEFEEAQQVRLAASEDTAQIFYTLDGTDPTTGSNEYTGEPVNIPQTATLKFIVVNAGGDQSEVFQQRYAIRPPTSTNLRAGSRALNFRQATVLTGRLVSGGEPLANKRVVLVQRPIGQQRFSRVPGGVLTTNARGNFSKRVRPAKNTIYRAVYRGEAESFKRSVSAPQRVNTRVAVTLNVSGNQISNGQRVGMVGVVRPSHDGRVKLIIKRGNRTVAVRNVALNNSRYRFVYRPPTVGNYSVRAVFPRQDRDHLGNFSRPVERFRVTR